MGSNADDYKLRRDRGDADSELKREVAREIMETMGPVFDSSKKIMAVMYEQRIIQNDVDALKASLAKLVAAAETAARDRAVYQERLETRRAEVDTAISKKADHARIDNVNEKIEKMQISIGKVIAAMGIIQTLLFILLKDKF